MSLLIPINDGFTLTTTIPAAGRRPAVTFSYRQLLPEAYCQWLTTPKKTGKEMLAAIVELLTGQLTGWDVRDAAGELVPCTAENLRRVPYQVLDAMVDYVTGYKEPEAAADAKN